MTDQLNKIPVINDSTISESILAQAKENEALVEIAHSQQNNQRYNCFTTEDVEKFNDAEIVNNVLFKQTTNPKLVADCRKIYGEKNKNALGPMISEFTMSQGTPVDETLEVLNGIENLPQQLVEKLLQIRKPDPKLVAECQKIYGEKDKHALRTLIDEFKPPVDAFGCASIPENGCVFGLKECSAPQQIPRSHLWTNRASPPQLSVQEEKKITEKPNKEKTVEEMLTFIEQCMVQLISFTDTVNDAGMSKLYILLLRAGMLLERNTKYSKFQRKALYNVLEKTIESFKHRTFGSLDQTILRQTIEFYEQIN